MDILNIEHLHKSFGNNQVIKDLSFSVPEHSVFGFLGQNGAGKTTTMKMVLGLLKADSGNISVCGEPVSYGQTKTNRFIGYLPDVPEFYNYMNATEYLRMCGDITGMSIGEIKAKTKELLALVGLENVNKRIGSYSRGMKQRLGIAQALLNDPILLICDEPTSALDPIGRIEILDILQRVKGKTTVIFSTHILSDVERICDRVAVLHEGKLVLSGTLTDIKLKHKQDGIRIEFSSHEDLVTLISNERMNPYLSGAEKTDLGVTLHTHDVLKTESEVIAILAEQNILPTKLEVLEPTLESLFIEVVR
ncbi:MAG: ABC transporter ATP-binding protein [Clostridiaceae bacterium]